VDRRRFLATAGVALALPGIASGEPVRGCEPATKPEPIHEPQQPYRIGNTTNTRGGWEGEPFKGMREGRAAGFRYMEIFGASFCRPDALYYPDDAEGLMRRIFEIGVQFVL
jgi:hypothetical protein